MADFLTTKSIQSNIESIITEAKKKIVIVSPFIKLSDYYMDNLTHAANRGVVIKILHGKNELHPNVLGNIESLKNVEIYFYEHLHAKCYLNESKMVITSMNLYDASERNREMGVLVDRLSDKNLFDNAVKEIQLILDSPHTSKFHQARSRTPKDKEKDHKGYCIRCRKRISFSATSPYCKECYFEWKENDEFVEHENFCHCCGKKYETSIDKPQCYGCYYENVEASFFGSL